MNILDYAMETCKILDDKKGEDILLLDIMDKTALADYFVICSGKNPAQVKALCDEVEDKMEQRGLVLRRVDGYQEGRWIVLDYADILVHIFHREEREYYNIERLWANENGSLYTSET